MKNALPYQLHETAREFIRKLTHPDDEIRNEVDITRVVGSGEDKYTVTEDFEEALDRSAMTPIEPSQSRHWGWLPVHTTDVGGHIYHTVLVGNILYMRFCKQVKSVPADVRDAEVHKRVLSRETEVNAENQRQAEIDGREWDPETDKWSVPKNELTRIKEAVVKDLLPAAFPKTTVMPVFINLNTGYLLVGTSSPNNAEEVLGALRVLLGGLRVRKLDPNRPVGSTLTDQFYSRMDMSAAEAEGDANPLKGLEPMDQITLVGHDNENMSFKGYAVLENQSVVEGIEAGNEIASIRARFSSTVEATFHCSTFGFKAIKFADEAMEQRVALDGDESEVGAKLASTAAMVQLLFGALGDMVARFNGMPEWPERNGGKLEQTE